MVASSLFLEGDWGNQEELAQTNIIIYIYIIYDNVTLHRLHARDLYYPFRFRRFPVLNKVMIPRLLHSYGSSCSSFERILGGFCVLIFPFMIEAISVAFKFNYLVPRWAWVNSKVPSPRSSGFGPTAGGPFCHINSISPSVQHGETALPRHRCQGQRTSVLQNHRLGKGAFRRSDRPVVEAIAQEQLSGMEKSME